MRPAAHSLSLRPPKKVSKERRPHVSDPALHCAALRYVPGKPAMTITAAARQNSLCDLRSRRSDNCRESDHDADACCAASARRRHRPRRRCLKGWANRAIAALGSQRALLRSPWHVGRLKCVGLASLFGFGAEAGKCARRAHSLSFPPPKKASKERRPHVSDPALHCTALRCVPGKPAMARACAPPGRERQTQRCGMGCKALSRGKAVALQGCVSRKSAQSAFLQPRTSGGQAHHGGGAAELALRSAIAPLGQLPQVRTRCHCMLRCNGSAAVIVLAGVASRGGEPGHRCARPRAGFALLALACGGQVHGFALGGGGG